MASKKKTSKNTKKNNKKSSSKNKTVSDTTISFTEDFEIDANGNAHKGDKIAISEENYIQATEYECSMSSYQDPENSDWRFALELHTDNGKLIDIHSQQTYKTFQDSIFDCYGIIEYLGFGVINPDNRAHIVVNHWDDNKKEFREEVIYFDGCDFYRNQKESDTKGN